MQKSKKRKRCRTHSAGRERRGSCFFALRMTTKLFRVCRVQRKNSQILKAKTPCKPEALIKAAAAKFKLKKAKELFLVDTAGAPADETALQRLPPMAELFLVRQGEPLSHLDLDATDKSSEAIAPSLPDEVAALIWAFVPNQGNAEGGAEAAAEPDLVLLKLSAVSKSWHRIVPPKFIGQGRWFWQDVLSNHEMTKASKRGPRWVAYGEETNWCIEDGFRRGAHQATVEIREAQMNSKGKKKKLAIIDYGKMTQGGMTGKGRTIEIRRLPRTWL